jgi:hypothetical protein
MNYEFAVFGGGWQEKEALGVPLQLRLPEPYLEMLSGAEAQKFGESYAARLKAVP